MIPLVIIDAKQDRSTPLGQYLTGTGAYRVMISALPEVTFGRNLVESQAVIIAAHEKDQNGILFLKKLREQAISIPVIILADVYDPAAFRDAVANRAEYLVMTGQADLWYPVLEQLVEKVSAVRHTKDEVEFLKKKLNIVGSVTRHDVLNQLTAVSGYAELLEMIIQDPQMKSYIEKERFALDKIRRQFQFSKDYQNLATEPPSWQSLGSVVRRASEQVALKGATIKADCGNASVYADILLEKAVAQLLDNAVRHGGSVSIIRLAVCDEGKDAVLIVEDNGSGIPAENKEKIFERGFGKHTGWGLFLAREILAVTGMTIAETGEPGKGARFEICIPSESYKKEGPEKATGA